MGPTNAPTTAGTFMFNDDCGSCGGGTLGFCTGGFAKTPVTISNASGELVLGLNVPDPTYDTGFYWDYSGAAGSSRPGAVVSPLLAASLECSPFDRDHRSAI